MPQIFFPSFDSHLRRNIFSDRPNDAEVDTATPKRLHICRITFYSTFMSIPQGYFGSKEKVKEKHSNRNFSYGTLLSIIHAFG